MENGIYLVKIGKVRAVAGFPDFATMDAFYQARNELHTLPKTPRPLQPVGLISVAADDMYTVIRELDTRIVGGDRTYAQMRAAADAEPGDFRS